LVIPLVLLATVATIIASQSTITGALSMSRQAIQPGWLPRMKITQTSPPTLNALAPSSGRIHDAARGYDMFIRE